MGKSKAVVAWYLGSFSVIVILAVANLSWRAFPDYHTQLHPIRATVVYLSMLLFAAIGGIAWWTIWMRKPSWIWWGTAASLLHIFAWVSMLPFGWRVVAEWFVAFILANDVIGYSWTHSPADCLQVVDWAGGHGKLEFWGRRAGGPVMKQPRT